MKPKTSDFNQLITMLNDLEGKGDIDSYVQIIQYCNSIKKQRDTEGRLIPVSIDKHIKNSIDNIIAEMAVSAGTSMEKALIKFEKATGMQVDEIETY